MARKSRRKNNQNSEAEQNKITPSFVVKDELVEKTTVLATAAYVRLSVENSGHDTDDSIKTQIALENIKQMGKNQYLIRLTDAQRDLLNRILCEEGQTDRAIMRAKILLRSDLSVHRRASLLQVAEELGTSHTTVLTVRTEFHKIGLEKAVYRKERSDNIETRRINTQVRGELVEMSRQAPPDGSKRWTLRLLASEAVSRGIVAHISLDTMASVLRNAGVVLK